MLFERARQRAVDYSVPILSFAQDVPGLGLEYRLSTFRLAVEVV